MQVLKEGKVTPASDVYSFAILMYELYTCKHLFKGMMHSQVRAAPLIPSSLLPVLCNFSCSALCTFCASV